MFLKDNNRWSEKTETAMEINQVGSRLSSLNCIRILLLFLVINALFGIALFGNHDTSVNVRQFYSSFDKSVSDFLSRVTYRGNKTILIWNSAHRIETAAFGLGYQPFIQHGCEVSDCVVFDNATTPELLPLEDYDAIIIHMHELWLTQLPEFKRQAHQRLIFLTQESPTTMPIDITILGNYFNWTMSYRLNSDIRLLYGRVSPRPTAPTTADETRRMIEETHLSSTKNYAANKTQPVGWMVSHCDTNSLRETYVRQLSKFIPVDVYGGCGNLSCSRNHDHWLSYPECYIMLEEKYKFYLSFENSICTDYATEKFFEILMHNIVPVVYGGANYSQIAPPHSYIDALDFTPEKLAEYLKLVDSNDTLYNEYFWWKDHYEVEAGVDQMASHGFCDLCKKLHQDQGVTKYYYELVSEWDPETKCKQMSSWEKNS
ncbi:alpha-(1,3)-fucosyltransferase C-like [Daphnia pulicaria]|uniref:alpha-(1,3)-fucosyltransferase C-like n=1 Tax=Daphnia pulicaria TaxID=35523 RepID=UPI001EEB376D|nr:alpha-(1,3)-fucosyltransferase C-like [Daphnia pulicaria]